VERSGQTVGKTVFEPGDFDVNPGDVFAIPPGHDAEIPGGEPCVMVDFGECGEYAKRT
jgi:mannose-6-phosphate isomerase-like protein (cupin superfamily)